jgi:MFS family permease
VVSRAGTQMRDVALSWHIYVLTGSPLALGLLGAARVVPILALAMVGGVAADALDRRRMMIATQSVLTATAAAMALLAATGRASAGALYALVALGSAASAFDNPARQALVVNLLPDEHVPNGLALSIFGWQAATVVGPAIGGVLLAATSVEVLYAADAVSFLAVIAALLLVRPRRPDAAPAGGTRAGLRLSAALDALRFLRTKPLLVWLMVADFLATFFGGSMLLLPIFAEEIFHAGARGLGLLAAAPAVGAVLASAWLSVRPPIRRQGLAVLGAIAVYGASVAAFGITGSLLAAIALLAISGVADTVSTVVRQVVRQTQTPDDLRGRMTGVNMMFFIGGPQLGEVEAGAVAQLTSARVSVVSGGIACVAVAAIVAGLAPSLRRLEQGGGAVATPGRVE